MSKDKKTMINGLNQLGYGADYCPEQHSDDDVKKHLDLAKEAGLNFLSVNIFTWSLIQKDEGNFNFEATDFIMNELAKREIRADLATPTASPPMWLIHKYPEVLMEDINGNKFYGGSRNTYCPNNKDYKRLGKILADKIAER